VIGLRPVEAANQPLEQSLAMLAEQARSNALLNVDVDITDDAGEQLDRQRSEAVYYIAADALGNIARHARARHASLRFFPENGRMILEVSDDGVGFDYDSATSGHGLGNMRERAFAVGGTLRVESRPGHGARVRLELPAVKESK
jgi:signal transduction histidine kinase